MSSPGSVPDEAIPEVFPPTLREVMVRPRWIGMLALFVVVAGVFAWLGQWQLGRALATGNTVPAQLEVVKPIDQVVKPGQYLDGALVGQRVSVSGFYLPGDFIAISQRLNEGAEGYWVTGQLRVAGTAKPTSIAVAIGWAPSKAKATEAIAALDAQARQPVRVAVTVTGRLVADEGPVVPPSGDPLELTVMSPAALLSRWHDIAGLEVYRPYLLSDQAEAGLATISAPPPAENGVNWLNLFYAVEWAVFAGFAFYMWYRLAKDAWEKECEELSGAPT
ncbi:MAG TPA: SURF1 family cytochrome oxidase biogenesis protein [Microbacterium sp.]|uniref:SURF1 family protein n=1 Tax=Microbacterium sp. TaxID=51671 RepID=UPI002B461A79|nr:SURF1 family cytochrome oxidase biogenesis protein [Microbacterium sp.]HKT56356.1 SURF1 family cytochrome oxidase biogenesis protein [Microbacterium sp.]